jgi:hypothetical protein
MEIAGIPYNEYHKNYYINKIKGCKAECECGLMVDKFRFARHRRSKKHIKHLNQNVKIEVFENLER